MSVRENTKSDSHRKTHGVEPGGAGRKYMHLTWGGPGRESARGVSRSHSSVDARRKAGGAKGRRTTRVRSVYRLGRTAGRAVKQGGATTAVATPAARRTVPVDSAPVHKRAAQSDFQRQGDSEDAQ